MIVWCGLQNPETDDFEHALKRLEDFKFRYFKKKILENKGCVTDFNISS